MRPNSPRPSLPGAFLIEALRLDLSLEEVASLQTRTEGWPAALYLAAILLRGRPDASALIERFASDDRYLVDYLTAEVLPRQTPELRSFLFKISIPEAVLRLVVRCGGGPCGLGPATR
jgi:LuxR family maltose regulon positive regulatory protein